MKSGTGAAADRLGRLFRVLLHPATDPMIKLRSPGAARTAVALSVLLALGACGSDDDDGVGGDGAEVDGGPVDGGPDAGVGPGGDAGGDGDAGAGTDADAELDTVETDLSADEEVPPVAVDAPDATGTGTLEVDPETGAIAGEVVVSGLTGPARMAHVHVGPAGVAGPVAIGLEPNADATVWTVPAGATLSNTMAGDVREDYARGNLYFNVHTEANPAGEVRGQIVPGSAVAFTVRIANVSDETTLPTPSDGGSVAVPLSPGAYVVHRGDASPLFESGGAASAPLEGVAEDGVPAGYPELVPGAVIFDTPAGAAEPGPAVPGGAYELSFTAAPGDKLSFVTMFVQSNDWFYTPTAEDDSISLFDDAGEPISGDVTDQVSLWDAGTEADEEPGTGPNQVVRQGDANTGPADPNPAVGSLAGRGQSVVLNGPVIEVTVTPAGDDS